MDSPTTENNEHWQPGLQAMQALNPSQAEMREIASKAIDLMREGMLLDSIAEHLNLSKGRISQLVVEFYPDEWKKAKTAANLIRYERAQQEFDNDGSDPEKPQDGTKLAYARERARFAHLMLQTTNREMFGDKPLVVINQGITMDQALDGMAQKLLAKMRVVGDDAGTNVESTNLPE